MCDCASCSAGASGVHAREPAPPNVPPTQTSPRPQPPAGFIGRARISVPAPRAGMVVRTRLLGRLEEARDRQIVLICAPAGYGKSMLATQWSARDPRPAAWIHLESADNDPVVLLRCLAEALDTLAPADPRIGAELASSAPRIPDVLLPLLADDLAGRAPFQLVLDDVQALQKRGALEVLHTVADAVPPGAQLVLATRTEPEIRLARRRAAGELIGLRAADLAFSRRETEEMVRSSQVALSEPSVATLHDRTEGWAAGLALALLSWEGLSDASTRTDRLRGEDREIAAYLMEEALERQPAAAREFLLGTSVLRRLSAPLCDAVLGGDGSARQLDALVRSNTFVTPLDSAGHWYRYHQLFRELTRAELDRRAPGLAAEHLGRAAAWHQANGDAGEAFLYARAAGDLERAGTVALGSLRGLIERGQIETARGWLARCTPEEAASDAQLAMFGGFIAMLTGDGDAASAFAASAEGGDLAGPGADGSVSRRAALANLRGAIGADGVEAMLRDGLLVRDEPGAGTVQRSDGSRAVGAAHLLAGQPQAAIEALSEPLFLTAGQPRMAYLRVVALGLAALAAADAGDWARARKWSREGCVAVEQTGLDSTVLSLPVLTAHAAVLAREGLLPRAAAALENLRPLIPAAHAMRWLEADVLLRCGDISLALGDVASAVDDADAARAALAGYHDPGALAARLAALDRRIASGRDLELTPAEIRLLPFLPSHLSLHEIGERVHLSRATIKTHVGSIYRKLDVSTRSEAVARIEALGLARTGPPGPAPGRQSPQSAEAGAPGPA